MKKTISYQTADMVSVIADYYPAKHPIGHILLCLHMMPANRNSWQKFAQQANLAGYHILAPDLRGHGESTRQNEHTLDFKSFTDEQHRETIKDIDAAIKFIENKNITNNNITIIGASIGANLTLQYLSKNHNISTGVLISPGLNYRSINLEKIAPLLHPSQSILLISGDQDKIPNHSINQIEPIIPGSTKYITLPTNAHGTNLFHDHPKLINRILSWINHN